MLDILLDLIHLICDYRWSLLKKKPIDVRMEARQRIRKGRGGGGDYTYMYVEKEEEEGGLEEEEDLGLV